MKQLKYIAIIINRIYLIIKLTNPLLHLNMKVQCNKNKLLFKKFRYNCNQTIRILLINLKTHNIS